jgi:hypothetical protein
MDKTLLGLMMIFFIAFTIFITFVVFNKQFTSAARASNQTISSEKSLMFAWPLDVKADGKTVSEITIFVRDDDGKAVPDKNVRVQTTVGDLQETGAVTDKGGKVLFHVSSATPGVAEIQAVVDNTPIRRKISVKFE